MGELWSNCTSKSISLSFVSSPRAKEREGAEEPCLQDGLRLEILGYLLCYCFSAHSKRVNLATKIRIFLETTKRIGGEVVQKRKSILNFQFPNGTMVHYTH